MKIINDLNFPPAYMKAISGDPNYHPDPQRIGVTELIDSPQIRRLKLEQWNNLVVLASKYFTGFLGTCLHRQLQNNVPEGHTAEKKWEVKIGNLTLVGKADLIDDGLEKTELIDDYKLSSMFRWSRKCREETEEKLIQQLNCLNWLRFKVDGRWSKQLTGHIFIKDWTIYKARQNKDQPQTLYFRVNIPIWPLEETEQFIHSRLTLHRQKDYQCNDKDKWIRVEKLAVMEKGVKKAKKLCDTYEEANLYILEKGLTKKYQSGIITIDQRKSECRRCLDWCNVRSVCPFAKGLKNGTVPGN